MQIALKSCHMHLSQFEVRLKLDCTQGVPALLRSSLLHHYNEKRLNQNKQKECEGSVDIEHFSMDLRVGVKYSLFLV